MLFSTEFLTNIFKENTVKDGQEIDIFHVATDTRKDLTDSLFVPLKGESFDAHNFLPQAIKQGAVAALWEIGKPLPDSLKEGFPLFFVEDTLKGLQYLAKKYLKDIHPTVISVTGSNGKTTTKDLIGAVTATEYQTHRTKGNFNNHIGLPLTILSMPAETEVLVLEMGMSSFGEIELLSKLAEPDFAIITNIGESHIEHLGSREGISKAKMEILAGLKEDGVIIFDGDEPLLSKLRLRKNAVGCGFNPDNDLRIDMVKMYNTYTTFSVNEDKEFKLGMLGRHNVKNACFAISVAHQLNISEENIKKALEKVELTGMRFELLEGKNGATIINDAYNASPTSMKASIEVVKEMEVYQKKILVLGDIFELGTNAGDMHRTVAEVITPEIDTLFTIGEHANKITEEVQKRQKDIHAVHFEEFSHLAEHLQNHLNPNNLILLKASRGMKMEQILPDLQ